MKKLLKKLVVSILGRQVRKLCAKHDIKIIGVVGGIGKTSTKLAIAQTLSATKRVRYQAGNYNDIVSVPLVFFGHEMPSLLNVISWIKIFWNNQKQIKSKYPFDVVVVELGTDGPGQVELFSQYLHLDIAVLTAIVPEHMEHFTSMQDVADEELKVTTYSDMIIYNADLVPADYRAALPSGRLSYSINAPDADFYMANIFHSAGGFEGDIKSEGQIYLHVTHEVVSETQLYSLLAAVVVSKQLGLKTSQILQGLAAIRPVSGRLRRLRGINNSIIIDDTYNSSPEAVKAGLHTLQKLYAPQKIAVLGNMNELGTLSQTAHKEIGELCDPNILNLLITIGPDANNYLAAAAEARGCNVKRFDDPYAVGEYIQSRIEQGAVIFVKGSQNGVFLEETIKSLLADPEDVGKLVRQTPEWMLIKEKQFKLKRVQ